MPGSVIQGKFEIKEWIEKHPDIKTIIDVGSGGCTYPKLLGDKYSFTAIEIWAPYVEQFNYKDFYDKVIIADVSHVIFPEGDCIIFGDVLEHLEKKIALDTLKRALEKYKHIVVSLPLSPDFHKGLGFDDLQEIRPAKIHFGNWFEAHKSPWYFEDIKSFTNWDMVVRAGKNDMGIFAK